MDDLIKIGERYIPIYNVAAIDDEEGQVLVRLRDAQTGTGEFRLFGEEAEKLRSWLAGRVAIAVSPATRTQDSGYRSDD